MGNESTCRICGRDACEGLQADELYRVPVCRFCTRSFAIRRHLAFCVDFAVLFWGVYLATTILLVRFSSLMPVAATNVGMFIGIFVTPIVFSFRDAVGGRSPGKILLGLQVVDQITREPIGAKGSFARNWVLALVLVPAMVFSWFGLIAIAIVSNYTIMNGPGWGDGMARTQVIWLKYRQKSPFEPRKNICRTCGYDLTGNVSGICSECGNPAKRRQS